MPSLLSSLWRLGTLPRGYEFPGTLKEREEQKVKQNLKLTRVDLLSLRSYLVVARVALQAGRALNTHLIYCGVDKVTIAYECERFLRKAWRI